MTLFAELLLQLGYDQSYPTLTRQLAQIRPHTGEDRVALTSSLSDGPIFRSSTEIPHF